MGEISSKYSEISDLVSASAKGRMTRTYSAVVMEVDAKISAELLLSVLEQTSIEFIPRVLSSSSGLARFWNSESLWKAKAESIGLTSDRRPASWRGFVSNHLRRKQNVKGCPQHIIVSHLVVNSDEQVLQTFPKEDGTIVALVTNGSLLQCVTYEPSSCYDTRYQGVIHARVGKSSTFSDTCAYGPRFGKRLVCHLRAILINIGGQI